jgi:hypothetical protein
MEMIYGKTSLSARRLKRIYEFVCNAFLTIKKGISNAKFDSKIKEKFFT